MTQCKFIDHPKELTKSAYFTLIEKIVNNGTELDSVKSIYQIGSVSTPGVSDLDLVFIFEDNTDCKWNPREGLNKNEKYLLVHNCFGCNNGRFDDVLKYTSFHNYKLLFGEHKELIGKVKVNTLYKKQIAIEYLIKMYITLTIQLYYKIIKLRSILLEIKAIKFDLEFLNIRDKKINFLVEEFIKLRGNWFQQKFNKNHFLKLLTEFHKELLWTIEIYLPEFNLPLENEKFKFAQNIIIKKNEKKRIDHKINSKFNNNLGAFLGRKYFNFLHKTNIFKFYIYYNDYLGQELENYFQFINNYNVYNKKHLPHFSPLISSFAAR